MSASLGFGGRRNRSCTRLGDECADGGEVSREWRMDEWRTNGALVDEGIVNDDTLRAHGLGPTAARVVG